MSRVGNNPAKFLPGIKLPGIVVSVITHLPNLNDYHENRFDVIRLCLQSMRDMAGMACKVLVWDNGSCDILKEWLMYEYKPDSLMFSENIGKQNAKTEIIRMQHPNTVIGISDDDMYFYDGWLKESVSLLQGFPNVGVVSAYPVRTQFRWGCDKTIEWCSKNGCVTSGKYITKEWDRDFCTSIGRDYEDHVNKTRNELDTMVDYRGLKALCTAHHCQFIGYAGILMRFPEWTNALLAPERDYDNAIDKSGYLRLTTMNRLSRHMGNIVDDDIKNEQFENAGIMPVEALL